VCGSGEVEVMRWRFVWRRIDGNVWMRMKACGGS